MSVDKGALDLQFGGRSSSATPSGRSFYLRRAISSAPRNQLCAAQSAVEVDEHQRPGGDVHPLRCGRRAVVEGLDPEMCCSAFADQPS